MATSRSVFKLPVFLAPAFAEARPFILTSKQRCFSTTSHQAEGGQSHNTKKKRDMNRQRGVSAIRSTGPRRETRAYKYPLPEPVKNVDPTAVPYEMNQEHGLYQFFNKDRDTMLPPNEEDAHGRGWTVKELSKKEFYDLWRLHWVCVKEQNRIATRNNERSRLKVGYGRLEISERLAAVRETMANIRKVMIKRHDDHSNGTIVLDNYSLLDIFPDAAQSLRQFEPESETEVFVNEIIEHDRDQSTSQASPGSLTQDKISEQGDVRKQASAP